MAPPVSGVADLGRRYGGLALGVLIVSTAALLIRYAIEP